MDNDIIKKSLADVREYTDQLKNELIGATGALEKLIERQNELKRSSEQNKKEYQQTATSVKEMAEQYNRSKEKLEQLKKAEEEHKQALAEVAARSKAAKTALDELITKQEQLKKAGKENTQTYREVTTSLEATKSAFDELVTTQERLKQAGEANAKAQQDATIRIDGAKGAFDELIAKQEQLKQAGEHNAKSQQDVAAQIRATESAIKQSTTQIDANVSLLDQSANSLEQNKGLLAALEAEYQRVSTSQGDNAEGLTALNLQIKTLGDTIVDQEKKVAQSRKVFDLHAETNKLFASSFDDLKAGAEEWEFGDDLTEATEGFNAMKSGLDTVKVGFTSVGGAIKTTGFGLLVFLLQSVVDYFTKTAEGSQKFKAILAAVNVVIGAFKKASADIGKILVDAFSKPGESLKKLGEMLVTNVINRFKGLKVILEGMLDLDFKKMGNGFLQATTGVTDLIDKSVDAFKKVNDKIQETVAAQGKKTTPATPKKESPKTGHTTGSGGRRKPKATPDEPTPARTPTEEMEAMALSFSQRVELDKKHHEQEQALLNRQLENKLITEETYRKKSDELQELYHQKIGNRIQTFNKEELAKLKTHVQDMVTIQNHDQTMADDKKAAEKAILPADKLAAEKKLIEDKYAYEIALAAGNAEKIKQLEEQKQQAVTDITKKYEEDRKAFTQQTMQAVSDTAFSMLKDGIKSRSDAKLKELNDQKQLELANTSLTGSQKQAIEAKYKKKEGEEKVKAFKAEQRASILQAVINGALAVTKATSQTGVLAAFAIPAIIVSTALQVATIAKQKPPQYAQGGLHYQSDGRGALLAGYSRTDNTNAYLRSGEAVVVSEAMRNPWARNLVSAINVAHGGRDFSVANPGRGYAIGGVFTDGGNANRYYNQPVTDAKELANTMAYQMINNFPPIYVDVKDVNNQQTILAQTVDRVNL